MEMEYLLPNGWVNINYVPLFFVSSIYNIPIFYFTHFYVLFLSFTILTYLLDYYKF